MDLKDILNEASALYDSGEIIASVEKMISRCDEDPDNQHLQINGGIWLMNHFRMTKDAVRIFERAMPDYGTDTEFLWAYAQTGFFADGDDPKNEKYKAAALKAISIKKDFMKAYVILIRILLRHKRYTEAFLVSQAALRYETNLDGLGDLAEKLMTGIRAIQFPFDGIDYQMPLNTETPACIFGSQAYLFAQFFEMDELRYTKEFVGQADNILEVGTLLGNHTAYYQKNLSPKTMTCVEAHPVLAEVTRNTAASNQPDSHVCETTVENYWADDQDGSVEINGIGVQKRPIDSFANPPYDFIKIDVDGAEMAVLAGAERTLTQGSPKIMIEVSDDTDVDVLAWMDAHSYKLKHTIEHHHYNNHFLERTKA